MLQINAKDFNALSAAAEHVDGKVWWQLLDRGVDRIRLSRSKYGDDVRYHERVESFKST